MDDEKWLIQSLLGKHLPKSNDLNTKQPCWWQALIREFFVDFPTWITPVREVPSGVCAGPAGHETSEEWGPGDKAQGANKKNSSSRDIHLLTWTSGKAKLKEPASMYYEQ